MKKVSPYLLAGFVCLIVIFSLFLVQKKFSSFSQVLGQQIKPGSYNIKTKEEVALNSIVYSDFELDTNHQTVNAVSLFINFDPDKLQVLDVDTSSSFCQFYPENKYDNNIGKISISCGAPNPGFTGKSPIAKVKFYTKNTGKTDIKIDPTSQILLNDGKGTNINLTPKTQSIMILNRI